MEKPVEFVNLKSLEKALNGLEKSLKEKRPALLHRIGNHLQNRISESFEEERSPLGGKWKPLALSTLERYYKRRYKQKHKKRFGGWGSKQERKQALEGFRGEKRIPWEARQEGFINVAIRNKKGDYSHSLNRDLWREELEKLLESQKDNRTLFPTLAHYEEFKTKLLNGINEESLGVFEQRELQSFEGMVGYCTFYNAYHPDKQKRAIGAHVEAIEFVLRQKIDNLAKAGMIVDKKSGEILIPSTPLRFS